LRKENAQGKYLPGRTLLLILFEHFSLHHPVQNGSRAHQTSYPTGIRALSLSIKRSGREAGHLPPSSADVKNAWSYTSTPPIRLHGAVLS